MWIWSTLQIAIAAGLATTFDDTLYLTGFFAEVDRQFRPKHVVVGELLGFSALLAISLIGYAIGMVLPSHLVGWLGIMPVAIGLQGLQSLLAERSKPNTGTAEAQPQDSRSRQRSVAPGFPSRQRSIGQTLQDRQTYTVMLVTISNGSNNLSIYIPLFASLTLAKVMVVIPVLYAFIATWLSLAYALSRMPGVAVITNRYARVLFPFLLIWLGLRILNDSGALATVHSLI